MRAASATATTDFARLGATLTRLARGKRVVGFDVFDTLLRRRVPPEYVKDRAARFVADRLARHGVESDWSFVRHQRRELEGELCAENARAGGDEEFRLRELAPRWVAACGGPACEELAQSIVAHELELERLATYPTPGVAQALAQLRQRGQRLIFVTDIYLSGDDVWRLLREAGLADSIDAGYCSSDFGRTKRSGRLFAHVLEQERLAPHELLFVGDNPHSDVDPARRLGIDVIHVVDAHEIQRRAGLQLVSDLARRNRFWSGTLARRILADSPRHVRASDCTEYQLGLRLAPAFIAFVRWVIDQAKALGLNRLLFASREGLTFLRMYRRIVRALDCAADAPSAAYFAASRRATFLPSLDELSVRGLHRLLRQYDRQPLARLLKNLNLPAEEFAPLAQRAGFASLDDPIVDPESHAAFQAFLADPQVQWRFAAHRDAARARMARYLEQQGFFDHDAVGLVDIGWKGSIQDNVVRAMRHRADCPAVHGLYFGLYHVAEDDVPRSYKHGYMADTRRGDWLEEVVFKNGPVFEMFSSAPHGGVLDYQPRRGQTDRVRPVLADDQAERQNFRGLAGQVFAAIDDYLREYLALAPLLDGSAADWRADVLDQLRRYILYPTLAEARSFLRYSHLESFGVFHQTTYEFKGSWRAILFGGSPLGIPRRFVQSLERQFWPQGILRRTRLPLVNLAYDLLETRRAGRRLPG